MSDDQEPTTSSFAIVITPEFDESGNWLGSVTAHIEEEILDDLNTEEITQIRSVCGLMASTLALMEEDPELMSYVKEYFVNNYQEVIADYIENIEDESPNFTRKGNVIELNFNTKTHGSA